MDRTRPDSRLREALARLAAEDLDEVIGEARAEARQRVRSILADALADEMLEQIRGREDQAAAGGRTEEPTQRTVGPDSGEPIQEGETPTGLYVFCVVESQATLPSDIEGLEPNARPRLVRDANLAAVVCDVSLNEFDGDRLRANLNDMQWLERTARAHERVLETIGQENTLVPMRLCSIYRSVAGVNEMLAREAPTLQAALDRLRGKAEWGVKVFANAAPSPSNAAPSPSNVAPSRSNAAVAPANGSGAEYMRQRQSDRQERQNAAQRQHDACVSIHERLAAAATEAMTAPPQRAEVTGRSEQMVLNGVYLVENDQRDEFLALVHALQEEHKSDGLELEPTGPWPAYNFVPNEIGAAA